VPIKAVFEMSAGGVGHKQVINRLLDHTPSSGFFNGSVPSEAAAKRRKLPRDGTAHFRGGEPFRLRRRR